MILPATSVSPAADEQLQCHLFDLWLSLCSAALAEEAVERLGHASCSQFGQKTFRADDRSVFLGAAPHGSGAAAL